MFDAAQLLISLHTTVGDGLFIALSAVIAIILSIWVIPKTTDLMVNNIAGIAGKKFGNRSRTLFINASTNNPEAFSMLVSFALLKMGGWSNPLGSLLANIYLLYIGAVVIVFIRSYVKKKGHIRQPLLDLLRSEKKLACGHMMISLLMFALGFAAMKIMTANNQEPSLEESGGRAVITGVLLIVGVLAFFIYEMRLKKKRPQLFDEMDTSEHNDSWMMFFAGTAGVIAACWLMNELFLAWSDIYSDALTSVFGPLIFAWLHYFVGAFITSLPEMTVAVRNLEKVKAPDLNTALGSVSYSNMVNMCIALIGLVIWAILSGVGVDFTWQ